ncbi:rhomboid family intramembrane serine protease [bacterium]|nr:rhomboid family intramembrane serine protease [bacterium]
MIPIRDQIKTRKTPIINYLLIAANILVFAMQWLSGSTSDQLMLIPANFLAAPLNPANLLDIFTSMFMHAGLLHLGGNMLYLWIFGDNVEDRMGSIPYLIFYLVGGIFATLAHVFTNPGSMVPVVGASGAIAAVLGAYLVLYPQSRILTFIPIGYLMRLKLVPAIIVLGLWFILQLFNGVLSLGQLQGGGTAFWAHVGGFVAGIVMGLFFKGRNKPAPRQRW